jgi:hypothetical protein
MANTTSLHEDQASREPKRLNEMNRLGDLGRFPLPVLCGETFNVLLTIAVVWHFQPATEHALFPLEEWIAGVLAVNLLPVVLLRLKLGPDTVYPYIEQMDFFRDQHKFSNWVYLAASANMAFWVLVTWEASDYAHRHIVIAPLLIIAFLATFFPAWIRLFRR